MVKKWILCTVGGAGVSLGLGVTMMSLIAGEFEAQEKHEAGNFEINPKVEEPVVIFRNDVPKELERVETPPPPPTIDKQKAEAPSEAIADVKGAIPDFPKPVLDPTDFIITVIDEDAQPLVRIPPIMPPRAERSGHCNVRFDVSASGDPYNVIATYCSQSMFSRPSIKSVQRWKYKPKMQGGQAVSRSGVLSTITFALEDERGNPIPE